jgi:hypothetical protein
MSKRQIDPMPTGPNVTWNDRIDWALVTLGIRQRAVRGMGDIVPILDPIPDEYTVPSKQVVDQ